MFVSGEISERTTHLARELGIHYIAAGHHATERYGVQALGSGWPMSTILSTALSISITPPDLLATGLKITGNGRWREVQA